MAGIDGGEAGTEYVGSHEKAKNGRGQNGDPNPSSVTDLNNIPAMDRDYGLATDPSLGGVTSSFGETGNWQTRGVSKDAYPTAFGMKSPGEPAKVPDANVRRASKQFAPGSFQR